MINRIKQIIAILKLTWKMIRYQESCYILLLKDFDGTIYIEEYEAQTTREYIK